MIVNTVGGTRDVHGGDQDSEHQGARSRAPRTCRACWFGAAAHPRDARGGARARRNGLDAARLLAGRCSTASSRCRRRPSTASVVELPAHARRDLRPQPDPARRQHHRLLGLRLARPGRRDAARRVSPRGLATVLGADRAKVMTTLASNAKFAYIARRFSKEKADQLRTLKLPGVGLQEETQRSYLPGIAQARRWPRTCSASSTTNGARPVRPRGQLPEGARRHAGLHLELPRPRQPRDRARHAHAPGPGQRIRTSSCRSTPTSSTRPSRRWPTASSGTTPRAAAS